MSRIRPSLSRCLGDTKSDDEGTQELQINNGQCLPQSEMQDLNTQHDGGLAGWTCVLGSFFALFCTFGWLNTLGLFQTYYQETLLSSYSASSISWIFTIQLCVMFSGGVFYGRIIDTYGTHHVAIPCATLITLCIALLSLCTEYYQIFLAQGLGFGIGAAGLFSCAQISVGQWFHKRKALALGIVAAGSSTGGVVHPAYLHLLIDRVGFPTAIRWSALVVGISALAACTLMRTRLPRKEWDGKASFFEITLFKQPAFSAYCLGSFLVFWGLFAPWNYLPDMSLQHDFSKSLAIYTIVVLNAGSIFGRILPSFAADHYGRFNTACVVSFLTGLALLAFWLPLELNTHSTKAQIFAFSAMYGFASGAFISIIMPCVADLGPVETLGQRFGVYQTVIGLSSLTGLPIQGALIPQDGGKFGHLVIFSGVCVIAGFFFTCVSRILRVGTNLRS